MCLWTNPKTPFIVRISHLYIYFYIYNSNNVYSTVIHNVVLNRKIAFLERTNVTQTKHVQWQLPMNFEWLCSKPSLVCLKRRYNWYKKKSIFLTPDNYTDLTLYSVLDLILEFGFFTHSVAYQFHNIHFLLFGGQRKSTLS